MTKLTKPISHYSVIHFYFLLYISLKNSTTMNANNHVDNSARGGLVKLPQIFCILHKISNMNMIKALMGCS